MLMMMMLPPPLARSLARPCCNQFCCLLQASAFFAGMTRMTISLAVTMVELTDDVRFLLPIMVTVIVSKVVADSISHPLYHALLEVKCIPYLPDNPKCVPCVRVRVRAVLYCVLVCASSVLLLLLWP